jgi:hypothetical protein
VDAIGRDKGLESGALASSFRRLSLRVERAACLRSSAGSVEDSGGIVVECPDVWLRTEGEGRVET